MAVTLAVNRKLTQSSDFPDYFGKLAALNSNDNIYKCMVKNDTDISIKAADNREITGIT